MAQEKLYLEDGTLIFETVPGEKSGPSGDNILKNRSLKEFLVDSHTLEHNQDKAVRIV